MYKRLIKHKLLNKSQQLSKYCEILMQINFSKHIVRTVQVVLTYKQAQTSSEFNNKYFSIRACATCSNLQAITTKLFHPDKLCFRLEFIELFWRILNAQSKMPA